MNQVSTGRELSRQETVRLTGQEIWLGGEVLELANQERRLPRGVLGAKKKKGGRGRHKIGGPGHPCSTEDRTVWLCKESGGGIQIWPENYGHTDELGDFKIKWERKINIKQNCKSRLGEGEIGYRPFLKLGPGGPMV